MDKIKKIVPLGEKLACITLDFEKDYDDITRQFNIFERKESKIYSLAETFKESGVPVSTFIRTDLLLSHPKCLDTLRVLAQDFHCHSHTHTTSNFDSKVEFTESVRTFEKFFARKPLGYRAPLGVLYENDIALLKKNGIAFSSSVFPSFRPGKFSNLKVPTAPFLYENDLVELPFAVIPTARYTVSLSYLKLIGFAANSLLYSLFGLSNVVVFDSHMHDYIIDEDSFGKLPFALRAAYGRNKYSGIEYYRRFVDLLRKKGYRFITITELYQRVKEAAL